MTLFLALAGGLSLILGMGRFAFKRRSRKNTLGPEPHRDRLEFLQQRMAPWATYRIFNARWGGEAWQCDFESPFGQTWTLTYHVRYWGAAIELTTPKAPDRSWAYPRGENDADYNMGRSFHLVGPHLLKERKFNVFVHTFLAEGLGMSRFDAQLEALDLQCQIIETVEILSHFKYFFAEGGRALKASDYSCYDCQQEWKSDFTPPCTCLWDKCDYTIAEGYVHQGTGGVRP